MTIAFEHWVKLDELLRPILEQYFNKEITIDEYRKLRKEIYQDFVAMYNK